MRDVCEVRTMAEVLALAARVHDAKKGLTFANIKIRRELPPRVMTSRAGAVMAERTRQALGPQSS